MQKIKVPLKYNPHDVYLGENIFKELPKIISKNYSDKKFVVISDSRVYSLYKKDIDRVCKKLPGKYLLIKISASEKNKSIDSLSKIYSQLLKNNFSRDTLFIAVAGGIIGDLTGFTAASFARGVPYVQIPTTLLAAVDSSIGGKTGVNFGKTKNIIGAFHQPEFVLIDTIFLNTLSKKEITCGLGEIVKYSYLTDETYFRFVEKNLNDLQKLNKYHVNLVIKESVKFKGSIVAKDEKEESGLRKVLNFGHTFAHAIEIQQKYKIKHGEAVIVGVACALYLSNQLNLLSNKLLNEYLELIKPFSKKIKLNRIDKNELYKIMLRDKKNKNEKINFVLIKKIGSIFVDVESNKRNVTRAIEKGIGLFTQRNV